MHDRGEVVSGEVSVRLLEIVFLWRFVVGVSAREVRVIPEGVDFPVREEDSERESRGTAFVPSPTAAGWFVTLYTAVRGV